MKVFGSFAFLVIRPDQSMQPRLSQIKAKVAEFVTSFLVDSVIPSCSL